MLGNRIVPFRTLLRLAACRPAAGFPSPADDHLEAALDLNAHLMPRPASTFAFRVAGCSMKAAGIRDQALLIVDRSIDPRPGHVVVAMLNGELLVKCLRRREGRIFLESDDPPWSLEIGEQELAVWGVATFCINALPR